MKKEFKKGDVVVDTYSDLEYIVLKTVPLKKWKKLQKYDTNGAMEYWMEEREEMGLDIIKGEVAVAVTTINTISNRHLLFDGLGALQVIKKHKKKKK